jgi:hypothetical protein
MWQIALGLPAHIFRVAKDTLMPPPDPTPLEELRQNAKWHQEILESRNAKVETLLSQLDIPEPEVPARRRWERVIEDSKREINEWDWDAQFGELEDTGDRQALYQAIFEMATQEPRLRRERFHREAIERVKRVNKTLPPIEKREFWAKEVAIAAAHGHIGDLHYAEIVGGNDGETMIARDKLYRTLVENFFIPHLEKFKTVIEKRDDHSVVEQTRWFWRPKGELLADVDRLLALCKLERQVQPEEMAEWIYELYMAPKFYTEMERRPGAALEYVYWVQGRECVPEGYQSPDEKMWKEVDELKAEAREVLNDMRKEVKQALSDRRAIGDRR